MSAGWRLPVLTYHAANVAGAGYAQNDHVALAADLAMFAAEGWRVVPLMWGVEQFLGLADRDLERCVALSCDDGTDLDVRDVDWPGQGMQRGFRGILADAAAAHPHLAPHLTSFVIADPQARARMDAVCLHGLGWMGEWWADADAAWDFEIGCHSWDHNHDVLEPAPAPLAAMARGDFFQVDDAARARFQIDQALAYINARIAPRPCRLFAYPYGHAGDYLRDDYLPLRGADLGLLAAFGVQGEAMHAGSDRWQLPRFVCGWHWKTPVALQELLNGDVPR
jgi:hypothetical protein